LAVAWTAADFTVQSTVRDYPVQNNWGDVTQGTQLTGWTGLSYMTADKDQSNLNQQIDTYKKPGVSDQDAAMQWALAHPND
ncbi:MAG TPA: hypothetical protein VK660_09960, partial [Xanthomonadaceae bacterium]|nr:hypothetical protein [Xanthomonadaceae bacterium]